MPSGYGSLFCRCAQACRRILSFWKHLYHPGKLTEGILSKSNTTTYVYKPARPITTIRRLHVAIPPNAEKETGFLFWLSKIRNIPRNAGKKLVFYAHENTMNLGKKLVYKYPMEFEFKLFENWDDFLIISREIRAHDGLVIVMSRETRPSYHSNMVNIPAYLYHYFQSVSFILIYPMQIGVNDDEYTDKNNSSLNKPIEKLDEIGKNLARLFRRK